MGRILMLCIILNICIFAQNPKDMLIVDETGKSILRIFVNQIGNGFFVEKHQIGYDFVISASHLFWCNSTIGKLSTNGILENIDRAHDEDLNIENVVALKDGKISSVSAYTYEGIRLSDVKILFNTSSPKLLSDPDRALLSVAFVEDVSHTHIPLMEDKVFDEIFYKDGIGKEVVARGFLLYGDGWFLRYRNAKIEWIRPNIFQINELLDNGLSGGPLTYSLVEKIYAVGVTSHGPIQQNARNFDMSWATIIKKSFLEKRNKK